MSACGWGQPQLGPNPILAIFRKVRLEFGRAGLKLVAWVQKARTSGAVRLECHSKVLRV